MRCGRGRAAMWASRTSSLPSRRRSRVSREELYAVMGPGGAAHVPRTKEMSLDEGVGLIAAAGGVTVLAHPGVYRHVPDLEVLFRTCAVARVLGLQVTSP